MTREEAIEELKGLKYDAYYDEEKEALNMAIQALEQEPRKGHWIYLKHNRARCSECDDVVLIAQQYGQANYCPNCGADVREVEE